MDCPTYCQMHRLGRGQVMHPASCPLLRCFRHFPRDGDASNLYIQSNCWPTPGAGWSGIWLDGMALLLPVLYWVPNSVGKCH